MAKSAVVEALNDLLQDLTDSTELSGGKVIVLGDFRQTLPVVHKATKSETIAACLTNLVLWPSLHKLHLKENMRAFLDPAFAEFLLKIGNRIQSQDNYDLVDIPASMLIDTNMRDDPLNALINHVYPNNQLESVATTCAVNRAILTTKKCFADEINDTLTARFPREETEYVSFDETIDPNDQTYIRLHHHIDLF
ncbi:ATP-dependent DNA helicase PIF1-like protein [Tanacetum coccineum]